MKKKKKILLVGVVLVNGGGESIFMWCFGKYLFEFLVSEDEVFIIIYIRNF